MQQELENSQKIQNKVVRLFTYLEKALMLDDTVVRDFRTIVAAPSPWWVADFPHNAENLHIKPFETASIVNDTAQMDPWLRVEKKNIKSAPVLPAELEEWIGEISPLVKPQAKEKIDREIRFDQDDTRVLEFKKFRKEFQQGDEPPDFLKEWVVLNPSKLPARIEKKYTEDYWSDHLELQNLLDGYFENQWTPWAEKVIKVYKANSLYDELYALRLLLKNEGDSYELLWGHGLLTWQHAGVGAIYAPIFLTPLTLDFDPAKRIIEVSPDPMFRGFIEISPLSGMENPAEMDLIKWSDVVNSNPFDFWHLEALKIQSRTLINYTSAESEDRFEDTIVSAPEITRTPSVWNAPVIFARKRTNDLWSRYASTIRRDIEQNNSEPTEFITDLVGDYQEEKKESGHDTNEHHQQNLIQESELFFPLPWNDEQKRIAERLDSNYGVVVKGPPGTGKSHTIANLISRFLAQGKTVLVTSQTSKALEVLRKYLPINIRSLAVSQLHQTAKRDDVLQQSITEISSNLGDRDTKFSEQKAEAIRQELQGVRQEKAALANQIRRYILTDSGEKLAIDGEEIRPMDAAKLISEHENDPAFAWFTDKINFETELNFTEADLQEAYTLLSELAPEERELYKFELPPLLILPSEDAVLGAFGSYRELRERAKTSAKIWGDSNPDFEEKALPALGEQLSNARNVLASINQDYEQEIFNLCVVSQNEQEGWRAVVSKIGEKVHLIGKSRNTTLGHDITSNVALSLNDFLEGVQILRDKVTSGSGISTFGKWLLSANVKKILEHCAVDGRVPDNKERIELLYQSVTAQQAEKEIKMLMEQSFSRLKAPPHINNENFDIVQLEVLAANLRRIVYYSADFADLDDVFKKISQLSDIWFKKGLSFMDKKDVEKVIEIVDSRIARFELIQLDNLLGGWIQILENLTEGERHPVISRLLEALRKYNTTGWKNALGELGILLNQKEKAARLNELAKKFRIHAPNLYRDIIGLADQQEKFECPNNLDLTWKIARLDSWLGSIHDHADIDNLQNKLERFSKREYQLNSDLVTILAWQKQIDKVTKKQRDALMAWSHEMKQYGRGTGKYAVKHLRAAQEALKEAKNAVPVWIMPLHRAAQMFSEPKAGMFDVIIFDEASQCDIRAVTIGYLGKKLLVVGDPEQISPAGIFQDQEKIFELISRFLFDMPFRESFSITSSFFDLAKIRMANIIQLNEHFRCVPDIIAFSNHHIYEGKLKPLRYPHPKGLLKPPLVPVFVENGYQNTNNKVNEPEAEAIVAKLVECLKDPLYQMRPDHDNKGEHLCTFGIISLLAEDQAKHIEKLIRNLVAKGVISEKTIEERQIECGDAYKFQGDERDVMFLSMVRALDPNNLRDVVPPLVDEGAKRRFNVAASRARDQMFLFYSIPRESLSNKNDWRYKLLQWFYDPKKEELNAGREALKREFNDGRASPFSLNVGNILIDHGYQVLPEYPVIGYRIDLVVQGEEARLAVECDGDQYHTLENWEEDQIRERQLRRAGWEFWRVTGSAFYRNKEKALDSLWKKLDELGIKPLVGK